MIALLLVEATAYSADFCLDRVEEYAAQNCLSVPDSLEVEWPTGPAISYTCDLGDPDVGEETFAVFSLAVDGSKVFLDRAEDCTGGDLWLEDVDQDLPGESLDARWVVWSLIHF